MQEKELHEYFRKVEMKIGLERRMTTRASIKLTVDLFLACVEFNRQNSISHNYSFAAFLGISATRKGLRARGLRTGLLFVVNGAANLGNQLIGNLGDVVRGCGVLGRLPQHFFFRRAASLKRATGHQIVATEDFCHGGTPSDTGRNWAILGAFRGQVNRAS
jgi:hypothetical protein